MAFIARQDGRVHLVAFSPSLLHCSAVPRWLQKAATFEAGRVRIAVSNRPIRLVEAASLLTARPPTIHRTAVQPRTMTREFVIALRDAYADKPRTADYLIAAPVG